MQRSGALVVGVAIVQEAYLWVLHVQNCQTPLWQPRRVLAAIPPWPQNEKLLFVLSRHLSLITVYLLASITQWSVNACAKVRNYCMSPLVSLEKKIVALLSGLCYASYNTQNRFPVKSKRPDSGAVTHLSNTVSGGVRMANIVKKLWISMSSTNSLI